MRISDWSSDVCSSDLEESLSDSHTIVERNIFDRTSGEVEIVSVKSGGNIVRENLVLASQGAFVLRHGNGNLVERNIFFGKGVPDTGGVRIINRDQTVRDNYFEGLAGRSEEHTSELPSLIRHSYTVFCLTQKKKQHK